jgi:c-di-GMP-binding flagellar brake protein YcgR
MFQDTRPAELGPQGGPDAWAEFRVTQPQERMRLLRALRDGNVPVMLNAPDGATLSGSLWAVDDLQQRLNFSVDADAPQLERLIDADEVVAVAYLQSVKLQFDVRGLVLVRGAQGCALQGWLPREIYRFQRRNAYRVRTGGRQEPVARFRHPGMPEMQLTLRMLDVSIGGCALWLPHDVPPLQAGTRLGELQVVLDADNRFAAPAVLQHLTGSGLNERSQAGARMGCEWQPLPGAAERVLQRWIDRAQQRRRLLTLG